VGISNCRQRVLLIVAGQRNRHREGKLHESRRQALEGFEGWVWDKSRSCWDGYEYLVTFMKREGHANVPSPHVEDGFNLGKWVVRQRQAYRKGKISDDLEAKLGNIKGWVWDTRKAAWDEGYLRLLAYLSEQGHTRVPLPYVVDNYPLGAWVARQRHAHSKKKLSDQRVRKLEQLDGWCWNRYEAEWQEAYDRLTAFAAKQGHVDVPWSFRNADGFRLGEWVSRQRRAYLEMEHDNERRKKLDRLKGWKEGDL